MEQLRMTKEEILDIAQKNTETASYTCQNMKEAMREAMINEGMGEELVSEMLPTPELPLCSAFCNISSGTGTSNAAAAILSAISAAGIPF